MVDRSELVPGAARAMNAVTEAEAKEKWCPFSRVSWYSRSTLAEPAEYGYAGNRDANDGTVPGARCIASACMAWRWEPLLADKAYVEAVKRAAAELGDASPNKTKAAAHVNANRGTYGLPEKPYRGYCGLAGRTTP